MVLIQQIFCEFLVCSKHVLGALQEIIIIWATKWANRKFQYHVVISMWEHMQSAVDGLAISPEVFSQKISWNYNDTEAPTFLQRSSIAILLEFIHFCSLE